MSQVAPYTKANDSYRHYPRGSVFQCPSFTESSYGYAFNSGLSRKDLNKISPAKSAALYDSSAGKWNANDPMTSMPSAGRHTDLVRHGINVGFADGHAKLLVVEHMKELITQSVKIPGGKAQ